VQQLSQALADTAATFAQQESVCVFNVVDECQVRVGQPAGGGGVCVCLACH
jgi:hypothetical protein